MVGTVRYSEWCDDPTLRNICKPEERCRLLCLGCTLVA
jgi:hypothetical protein